MSGDLIVARVVCGPCGTSQVGRVVAAGDEYRYLAEALPFYKRRTALPSPAQYRWDRRHAPTGTILAWCKRKRHGWVTVDLADLASVAHTGHSQRRPAVLAARKSAR